MATTVETASVVICKRSLQEMGFDVSRLRFYGWLVEHGMDPEYVGVKPLAPRPIEQQAISRSSAPSVI